MEKNYYPLRVGKVDGISTVYILCDIKTNNRHMDYDGCTGWVVAEGQDAEITNQIVNSYNEKYGPKIEAIHIAYSSIKHLKPGEGIVVNENRITLITGGYHMVTPKGYWYREDKTKNTDVTVAFIPVNTAEPSEDIKPLTGVTIKGQLQWLESISKYYSTTPGSETIKAIKENLIAIQRWNQNPIWKQLDVEKVIEDLLFVARTSTSIDGPAIQNAEAALGMLRAFKDDRDKKWKSYKQQDVRKYPLTEKEEFKEERYNNFSKSTEEDKVSKDIETRGHIGPELQKTEYVEIPPLKDGKIQKIIPHHKDVLRREIASRLPDEPGKHSTAAAIIYAIEEVLKLRNL